VRHVIEVIPHTFEVGNEIDEHGIVFRVAFAALDNLTKYTKKTVNENLTFSPAVGTQLTEMYALLQSPSRRPPAADTFTR